MMKDKIDNDFGKNKLSLAAKSSLTQNQEESMSRKRCKKVIGLAEL